MQFTSIVFLFLFLPVFCGLYFLTPGRYKNITLLLFSIFFYFSLAHSLVLVLLFSGLLNYTGGILISRGFRKTGLITALLINILLLFFYKYAFALAETISSIAGLPMLKEENGWISVAMVVPVGISFFTFRAISYLVDVYRGKVPPCRNPIAFFTWFSMFPLLLAGPIVRYAEIQDQLKVKRISPDRIVGGIERIIIGLAKKILIAGTFSYIAKLIFDMPVEDLSIFMAWLGILAYTFEIYYDFSGYSDIAIGLGKMFGFDFGENFNFPYIAKDIRDFWRRWHISLSGWLRDYLFLPMAYLLSRKLPSNRYLFLKTDHIIYAVGITITFFICGLWHGATANFIVWGLYFALFLMVEQLFLGRLLKKLWTPVRHFYTLLVVVCSWVIFRSDSLSDAGHYFEKMFVYSNGSEAVTSYLKFFIFSWETLTMLVFAILFATPVYSYMKRYVLSMFKSAPLFRTSVHATAVLMLGALLIISLSYLTVKTYEPFIYFRF